MHRRAILALVLPVLASCILAVSPDTYGERCRFSGEETQCGGCVLSRCAAEVNATCANEEAMRSLEGCSERRDERCDALRASGTALGACVASACAGACSRLSGTSTTTCAEPPFGRGSACRCDVGAGSTNDFACSPAAYPETICCAPMGFPQPGQRCTCSPVSCIPTADGCFCSLRDSTPEHRSCNGVRCCADVDTCTCRAGECHPFEVEVPSCDITVLGCGKGQVRVDDCSPRTP